MRRRRTFRKGRTVDTAHAFVSVTTPPQREVRSVAVTRGWESNRPFGDTTHRPGRRNTPHGPPNERDAGVVKAPDAVSEIEKMAEVRLPKRFVQPD